MITPVQGLSSVLVYSKRTLPNFDKILIVRNAGIVYEFLVMRNLASGTSKEATLVYEYPAVSIRFTRNGMCVNPRNSALPPPIMTPLVLRYNCGTLDSFFIVAQDNTIRHIASGLCVDGNINKTGSIVSFPVDVVGGNPNQPPVDSGGDGGNLNQPPVDSGGDSGNLNQPPVDVGGDGGGDRNQSSVVPARGGNGNLLPHENEVRGHASENDDDGSDIIHSKLEMTGDAKLISSSHGRLGKAINNVAGRVSVGSHGKPTSARYGYHGRVISGGESKLDSTGNNGNEGEVTDISKGNGKLTSGWSRLHKNYPHQRQKMVHLTFEGSRRHIKHPLQYASNIYSQSNPLRPILARALLKDHEEQRRNGISEIQENLDKYVHLFLGQNCSLKFRYTTDSVAAQSQSTDTNGLGGKTLPEGGEILPEGGESLPEGEETLPQDGKPARGVSYRNLRARFRVRKGNLRKFGRRNEAEKLKKQEVFHSPESNKRALTTDLKYVLQENETELCIGYVNKPVVLMPCQSVPSSVKFYGRAGNKYTPQNKEQLRKPVTSTGNITMAVPQALPNIAVIPSTTATPAVVTSPCGISCPSTCYPSCTSTCCNTGVSNSLNNIGSCGGTCPSSCYPSCSSSCCDTGSPNYQGMSSPSFESSCPSSCDSGNQICPSSQCPQSCCPDQGGSYSYMSQSQRCPSGCKKHCRPSCPFNCC